MQCQFFTFLLNQQIFRLLFLKGRVFLQRFFHPWHCPVFILFHSLYFSFIKATGSSDISLNSKNSWIKLLFKYRWTDDLEMPVFSETSAIVMFSFSKKHFATLKTFSLFFFKLCFANHCNSSYKLRDLFIYFCLYCLVF